MAFSQTMTEKIELPGGLVLERGTWNGAAVTTGDITADTVVQPEIVDILEWGFASNGDTAVLPAKDVAPNKVKITFTTSDTGNYWIKGKAR